MAENKEAAKTTGIVGFKISCGAERGESGFDGDLAYVVLSFQVQGEEPVQVVVPLFGKNYRGFGAPKGIGRRAKPRTGETTKELAGRLSQALAGAMAKRGKKPPFPFHFEARTIYTEKRLNPRKRGGGGGGGGSRAQGTGGGGFKISYDYLLRFVVPDAKNVDAGVTGGKGKILTIGFSPSPPKGGGAGLRPDRPPPPPAPWTDPEDIDDARRGWDNKKFPKVRRPKKKCDEPAVGPKDGFRAHRDKIAEEVAEPPGKNPPDPWEQPDKKNRDTGWRRT